VTEKGLVLEINSSWSLKIGTARARTGIISEII